MTQTTIVPLNANSVLLADIVSVSVERLDKSVPIVDCNAIVCNLQIALTNHATI